MMKKNNFNLEANFLLRSKFTNISQTLLNLKWPPMNFNLKLVFVFIFLAFMQNTVSAGILPADYTLTTANLNSNFKTAAKEGSRVNLVKFSAAVNFLMDDNQILYSQLKINQFTGFSAVNTFLTMPNLGRNFWYNGGSSDSFNVMAKATYSLTGVSAVATACTNAKTTNVTLTSTAQGLPKGTYTVTYSLSFNGNSTVYTSTMIVSSPGSGQFTANLGIMGANNSTTIRIDKLASGSNNTISANNVSNTINMYAPITPTAYSGYSSCSTWNAQWQNDTFVSGYFLDVATTSTFNAGSYVSGFQNLDVGNVIAYPITGLTPGDTYYYRVRNNGLGCGVSVDSNVIKIVAAGTPSPVIGTITQPTCTVPKGNFIISNYSAGIDYGYVISPGTGVVRSGANVSAPPGNYTITSSSNGCVSTPISFTIDAVPGSSSAGTASASPNICINTTLPTIKHTTTGAKGIANDGVAGVNGLPAGVSATWASNVITINGTPTVAGTFNYSIPLTGGCGTANATGKITVLPSIIASVMISGNNIVCPGGATSLTFTATPTNGGTAPKYQWQLNGNNISGANSSTYTSSTLNLGDIITAILTSNATPCLTGSPAKSNEIKLISQTTVYENKGWSIPPAANLSAEIRSEFSTSSMDVKFCSLVVTNNAAVVIKSGGAVQIQNNLTVDPGSSLLMESDANLIQINKDAKNSGNITAEREITALRNSASAVDYVYWSSPVTGQKTKGADGFSPDTPNNRFYSYRESNDRFYETADDTFTPGKGYAVRAEDGKGSQYDKTYSFKGLPNNGDISLPIIRSNDDKNGTVHGYNMVGNPYPSNISFDELYYGNSDLIYNTAYFWTNFSYEKYQQGSGYGGNNYAVYNATGGNPASTPAGKPVNVTGTIKVGQGFLVQKKVLGSSSISFTNAMRSKTAGTFFQKTTSTKNRFWLNLSSPSETTNTQLIGYVQGGSNGYEQDFDAEAFDNYADLFYSVLSDKKLVIQGRDSNFNMDDTVPLGANFFQNGTYTISLGNAEGIFKDNQLIYLKDKVANITTNLSQNSYTFQAIKGNVNDRFEIVYQPESFLATNNVVKKTVQVYRKNSDFVISSPSQIISSVEVYDASGRLLNKISPSKTEVILPANILAKGILILKINLKNGQITTRKIRN